MLSPYRSKSIDLTLLLSLTLTSHFETAATVFIEVELGSDYEVYEGS